MGTPYRATVTGPFLETIQAKALELVDLMLLFVRGNATLRAEQSANAPLASGFQQGTITATGITVFDAAQSGARKFSYVVILIEDTAGAVRYLVDGSNPSAAGRGHKIAPNPTGASVTIPGAENVKNLKLICETGQTAPFTMQGFL